MQTKKARSQIYDAQNAIEDQRAGGASLEEVAAKSNLKVLKFTGLTDKGATLDGKAPASLPAYPNLLQNVYASEAGDQVPPGDTGNGGYYWIRVDNVESKRRASTGGRKNAGNPGLEGR